MGANVKCSLQGTGVMPIWLGCVVCEGLGFGSWRGCGSVFIGSSARNCGFGDDCIAPSPSNVHKVIGVDVVS